MLAILCPGQGAQTPGFLTTWLDVAGFRDQLETWSAVAGFDLVHAGTSPDADVVDLAAGTGKLTRLLAERFDRVVAVGPDERMRALLDARSRARPSGFRSRTDPPMRSSSVTPSTGSTRRSR